MSFNHASVLPMLGELLGATKKSSGISSLFLPILLVLFLGVYFLWLRPQRNRLRQQQMQNREAQVGDEIVTSAGIVGKVIRFDADRVVIETGDGHTMTILRSAVARRIDPPAPDYPSYPEHDDPVDRGSTASAAGADGAAPGEGTWWPEGEPTEEEGGST